MSAASYSDLMQRVDRLERSSFLSPLGTPPASQSRSALIRFKESFQVAFEWVCNFFAGPHERFQGGDGTDQREDVGSQDFALNVHGADVVRAESLERGLVERCELLRSGELFDKALGSSELAHESSPSVGAPSGAVCDNSNPTDGDHGEGAAVNPHAAAPDSP